MYNPCFYQKDNNISTFQRYHHSAYLDNFHHNNIDNYSYYYRHKLDSHYSISTTNILDENNITASYTTNQSSFTTLQKCSSASAYINMDVNMDSSNIKLKNNSYQSSPSNKNNKFNCTNHNTDNNNDNKNNNNNNNSNNNNKNNNNNINKNHNPSSNYDINETDELIEEFRPRSQTWGGENSKSKINISLSLNSNLRKKLNLSTESPSVKESYENSSVHSLDQYDPSYLTSDGTVSSTVDKDSKIKTTSSSSSLTSKSGAKKSSRRNPWGQETYAELIEIAIESYPHKMATLQQIYDHISFNYNYFRERNDSTLSAGWKNSIRHNLSLHERFIKCPKKNENIKSSLWAINHKSNNKRNRTNSLENKSSQQSIALKRKIIKKSKNLHMNSLKSECNSPKTNMMDYSESNSKSSDIEIKTESIKPKKFNSHTLFESSGDAKLDLNINKPKIETEETPKLKWPSLNNDLNKINNDNNVDDDDDDNNYFSQGYTPQGPYKPQGQIYQPPNWNNYSIVRPNNLVNISPSMISHESSSSSISCNYMDQSNSNKTVQMTCPINSCQQQQQPPQQQKQQSSNINLTTAAQLSSVITSPTEVPLNKNNTFQYISHAMNDYGDIMKNNNEQQQQQQIPQQFQKAAFEYSKFIADLFINEFDE